MAKIKIYDTQLKRSVRISSEGFGEYLRTTREATPSTDWGDEHVLSAAELARHINVTAARLGEPLISAGTIRRLERDLNVFGGHMLRVRQVCRSLELRILVGNADKAVAL